MKNLLMLCLVLNTTSSLTYANDVEITQPIAHVQASAQQTAQEITQQAAEAAIATENARVQLVLKSYAEIVHFYASEIDTDTLEFLAIKSAQLEAHLSQQLDAAEDKAWHLIAKHFTLRFAH